MMSRRCFAALEVLLLLGMVTTFRALAEEAESLAPTPEQAKFFETDVRPLLANHCFKCHGPDKQSGELRLDSRAAMLQGGDSGPAIVPGKPEESLLIEAVKYESFEMPPSGQLDAKAIDVLTRWIAMGAPWPGDTGVAVRSGEPLISDEDRAWWAFQPVREPPVPEVDDNGWSKSPIDKFIYQKLAENGLTPSQEADRRTLLRRASFDLTGLPPTPEEVEAFLADTSPNAYEAMIDRLLDSPRYGEHWARYWLDLVRYAESDGYRQDAYRPTAWRYRDYVIKSFNDDKPYDQFVREQLAGDEIAPHDPEALAATGYLRLWIYEYNQRDAPLQWETILNDITDVTADVFLGMGMGCARCHNHKFDPILQEDYFRLQAFFTPILPYDQCQLITPEQRREYEAQLAQWEAMTAEIRAEMEKIEAPHRLAATKAAVGMFPPEIQAMCNKPEDERTPRERQLVDLVLRQVENWQGRIKGDEKKRYDELKAKLAEFDKYKPAPPPTTISVRDVGLVAPPTVIPGDRRQRDIPPGFLTVLDPEPAKVTPRPDIASTGRRTALAEWINREDNPLTHRVIVNRLWQHHFGQGLVATPNDFGRLGEPPSHPELLDWLVVQFLKNGRRLKPMHRLMMNTATYRQSALADHRLVLADSNSEQQGAERNPQVVDPSNRLLWRMNIRRLRAEQVRDAILAATGELDLTMGGEGADLTRPRRAVYLKVLRNTPEPLLEAFDVADGFNSTALRQTTTTANQALLMFNGPWMLARAKALKTRLEKEGARDDYEFVNAAWRIMFSRAPTTSEVESSLTFLREQAGRVGEKSQADAERPPLVTLPGREGQAADISEKNAKTRLAVADNPSLPSGDFTIEAYVLLRSLYEDAAVRVIASQWNGNTNSPGWSLGVTSKQSRYTPQNLILQIVGDGANGQRVYQVVPSNILLDLNKPYYVAASVSLAGSNGPQAMFYVKELGATEKPLNTARVPLQVHGGYRSKANLVVGGRDEPGRASWDGLLDDVRLSAIAVPPEQLLINSTAPLDDVVGMWRFENEPGFYADESGRQNALRPTAPPSSQAADPHSAARVDFCHVLLNTNEFLYVE